MVKRKTPEEYLQECKDNNIDLPTEPYINARTLINHKCKLGHIYPQTPHNHLQGQGCPICKKVYRKTPEDYCNECKSRGIDLPTEDYIKALIPIKHKCKKGHIYEKTPNNHLQGQGCPICKEIEMEEKVDAKYYL